MFTRFVKSFAYACKGLSAVWREEVNFRIQVIIAVCVFALLGALSFPYTDIALTVLAASLVFGAEVLNTIVEDLLNRISRDRDPVIGKIKDMAAGFVLIASLGALAVGILIVARFFAAR